MLVGNMQYYLDCYYGAPELAKVVGTLTHRASTCCAHANAQIRTGVAIPFHPKWWWFDGRGCVGWHNSGKLGGGWKKDQLPSIVRKWFCKWHHFSSILMQPYMCILPCRFSSDATVLQTWKNRSYTPCVGQILNLPPHQRQTSAGYLLLVYQLFFFHAYLIPNWLLCTHILLF